MKEWWRYRGDGKPHQDWVLPDAPSWRAFAPRQRFGDMARGATFQAEEREIDLVNAALMLRRPLLITGAPGTGKSSLAFAVAYELDLGPVLYWPINSRSTLREGLYEYDAIGRLQDNGMATGTPDIGPYLTLNALGTALLPRSRPRVLLIDELDKGDIDLPNDLLNVFEEGGFPIPELVRLADRAPDVEIRTADGGRAVVGGGEVRCSEFPFVVLTSNGERDFPPAFLRRCLQLDLKAPDRQKLIRIVRAHLDAEVAAAADPLITEFLRRRDRDLLATDQLLNAVYLLAGDSGRAPAGREALLDALLRSLGEAAG
ncbi:AAA family ATPase [Actinoplanes utahensis]|uniref:ATPase AAA n=1 Tax=Actinoplanes utahensis TaxID=1869 RepID=A0A0A6UM64_ACTUT|nr:MoxR family ATPase [Actinoplanes utahensis]KHD75389.1 ATPase AAA [Actinoplanes utahensis]GIF33697.1 ATPase AAA [Actinoplanes utahensis]